MNDVRNTRDEPLLREMANEMKKKRTLNANNKILERL